MQSSPEVPLGKEPHPAVVTVEAIPLPEDRIGSLDLIRGIAILGILPVNMAYYMAPAEGLTPTPQINHLGDHLAAAGTLFVFSGKMILQLAVLFGAGLAIQGLRADAASRPFAFYYVRRTLLLGVIGLSHALLLWYGDILLSYAILGLVALPLRPLRTRTLLWCVAGFMTWYYLLIAVFLFLGLLFGSTQNSAPADELPTWVQQYMTADAQRRIYLQGPYSEMVIQRAFSVRGYLVIFLVMIAWGLLACFLLGMVFLRWGFFLPNETNRRWLRRIVGIGLGIGLPLHLGSLVLHASDPKSLVAGLLSSLGAFPQAMAYLALAILWHAGGKLPRIQALFQAVGRMALTNYLMQSVLCGFIYYGYGLALFGKLGAAAGFGIAAGIWALELAWSPLWLRYFTMGPVEWLWRSLADGRVRTFFRSAA